MNKIITLRTVERYIAEQLKMDIEARLEEHVNCTWYEGAWQVVAEATANEIDDIEKAVRDCENFFDGEVDIEIEISE